MHQPTQELQLGLESVILSLTLLFPGTAVLHIALARINADGPIDVLSFKAFVDLIGTGEFCELDHRFAEV